jgi:hypothetical protein
VSAALQKAKIFKWRKCTVVPSKFCCAKFQLGEVQEVLEKSRSDEAIKRHVFSLLLPRFSFE